MAKERTDKTNAMRLLDAAGTDYTQLSYDTADGRIDGLAVAKKLGLDPESVCKTLVCLGASRSLYVFVIPVVAELDLKKAARAANEKSIAMLPSRELLKETGYIHGGCSPIGMKRPLPTFLEEAAQLCDKITFSGGKIGCQIQCAPDDLLSLAGAVYADLICL